MGGCVGTQAAAAEEKNSTPGTEPAPAQVAKEKATTADVTAPTEPAPAAEPVAEEKKTTDEEMADTQEPEPVTKDADPASLKKRMMDLWTADFREMYKVAWLATADSRNFYTFDAETWAGAAPEFGNIDPTIAQEKVAEVPFLFPVIMTQDEFDGAVAVVKSWGATDETALEFMRAAVRIWKMVVNDGIRNEAWAAVREEADAAWGDSDGSMALIELVECYTPYAGWEEESNGEDY